jgi:acetylornithine deacetylase
MKTSTRELLARLVAIDSVNPSLVAGARGEAAAAQFVLEWLRGQGIEAELEEAAPGRPNVVAWIGPRPASSPKPRAALMVIGHLDTVGAGDMPEPFTPREREGRLYGRGALDIKSGVAAMCAAAAAVVREGKPLAKPLLVAGVADEECNSMGTQALLDRYSADAAVVLEPTGLKLCIAHKGYAWLEVTTQGRAAHGSLPQEGRDAIRMMGRVLTVLDALDRKLAQLTPHPLLGTASLHASLIEGGHELSSYPAECRLQLERRTLPGESDAQIEAEIRGVLEALALRDAEFRATCRMMASRAPYQISPDAPIAAAAAEAIRRVTGGVEHCGMPFWTDTALLAAAGIPGVVFGPRGQGMHGAEEYVELESVTACAEVLRELMLKWCG